jgi:hypothetical protein
LQKVQLRLRKRIKRARIVDESLFG